ncbi:MAG: UPF0147 family protein [Thermoplasmata archaeon]|jgi:hypothetical protein|nr:UPF0147 family protein [Thermoplasmata archaeon]MVT13200.1 hypothetical protein [Euryarchaeota archaeon]MVT14268.1 hypothetical protein [Euryarchaeota archaeon]MVT36338.1 hypothetical protein [Euryarchaeota archaeon]
MSKTDEELKAVLDMLDDLIGDQSIPRNLRKVITETKEKLLNKKESLDLKIASAIFALEDLVNDPSLPIHARSSIFTIIGRLESISSSIS